MKPAVEIRDDMLLIDGEPRVLLCSSLFPFRIPPEQWAERLQAVRRLGYHCIDVYVPWNHHERAPGQWDFTGGRDIARFLDLAAAAGLLVLARPGPYICSEWDGGGLPAWLGTVPGLRIRQNEPTYLSQVERWFAHVIPILAERQHSRGGPVILVQLENELDFFDCADPAGYIAALRDSAVAHGIEVPLVACAGQGDISRATGDVDHVVPAVNLYPDDGSTQIEAEVAYFESALRSRGIPLLVTETNRMHRTLKRLLVGGVRLLGPYLQASGWNYGYSTAINNWGEPLAFMTHDYDFGGALAPNGAERADAVEGRLMAALINALGPRLAAARPIAVQGVEVEGDLPVAALALAGGGELLGLTNLGDEPVKATVSAAGLDVPVELPANCCLLLPRDLPLDDLGPGASLVASTAELAGLETRAGTVRLDLVARGAAVVTLRLPGEGEVVTEGDVRTFHEGMFATVTGTSGSATFTSADGSVEVWIRQITPPPAPTGATAESMTAIHAGPGDSTAALAWRDVGEYDGPPRLESVGVYTGTGRYETKADLTGVTGLALVGAADVVDLRIDGAPYDWFANAGTDAYVAVDTEPDTELSRIDLRVQIWGHSNFDDGRLPALRLGSLRGVEAVVAVRQQIDLAEGWSLSTAGLPPDIGAQPRPRSSWGGWMSARFPQTVRYEIDLPANVDGDAVLRLDGNRARHDVELDGHRMGEITPLQPTLWLGRVRAGQLLSVTTTRSWGEPTGHPELLVGTALRDWRLSAAAESEVVRGAAAAAKHLTPTTLPIGVEPGEARWVAVDLRTFSERAGSTDAVVRFAGHGLMITAVINDTLLGRVWAGAIAPASLKGGRGDVLVVPHPWIPRSPNLFLRLDATSRAGGRLDSVQIGGDIDAGLPPADETTR